MSLRIKRDDQRKPFERKIVSGTSIVVMNGISKRFDKVLANDRVDFEVRKGEIHALLGENGAGKTTLMKILFGLYKADEGTISVKDKVFAPKSPRDAIKMGLGMVQQHFALVPKFTVIENIIVGLKSAKEPFLDLQFAEAKILELSETLGLKVEPKRKVWQLSIGEQQRVEILKSLYRGADILILDEPTAVLTPKEVENFFSTLKSMVQLGLTIIFITHKLPEVFKVCDRVTVLRRGKLMATLDINETNEEELAKLMIGRILCKLSKKKIEIGKPVLTVKNLMVLGDRRLPAVKDISFQINAGEILGIAGVAGNGQRELAESITGMRKAKSGQILIGDEDMTSRQPGDFLKLGVANIPEDRRNTGTIANFDIAENSILTTHSKPPFAKKWLFNFNNINSHAEKLISDYNVITPSKKAPLGHLSGGNVQKLILARELSRNPKLIIANKPTRGLDVGSTEFVRLKLLECRENGVSILLISEDLEEILCLSDRIAVMYEGRITKINSSVKANINEIGLLMAGINPKGVNSK